MNDDLIRRLRITVRDTNEDGISFVKRLLGERNEAADEIERLRVKLAEAQEYLGLLIPHASKMDNEAPEWLHSGEVDPVFVNVPRAILRAAAEWMEAGR